MGLVRPFEVAAFRLLTSSLQSTLGFGLAAPDLAEAPEQAACDRILCGPNVALGENQEALRWLEATYGEHAEWLPLLKVGARFDDPRP
jgi:hypothetical protein